MWRGKRRIRLLEDAVAEARADQAELRQRVALFEQIAEAAGVALDDAAPAVPVPPPLLIAARDRRQLGTPVHLALDGSEVIAVIGGEGGDPREWWIAIRRLASGLGGRRDPS